MISIANENDIPDLVKLLDSAYRGEGSKQGWTSEADLFIGEKRTDEAVVAELMKRPGAVFLKYENDLSGIEGCVFLHKKGNKVYLGMFSVSPGSQGRGIGKKILNAADDFAREHNCIAIYMTVITARKELISWYEKNGYSRTGETIPFPVDERYGVPTQPLELMILEKSLS